MATQTRQHTLKQAKTADVSLEDHLQALRADVQVTLDTQATATHDHFLKHMRVTIRTHAEATQDHLTPQLHTSLTLVD